MEEKLTLRDMLRKVLLDLNSTGEVYASAIVSRNGLLMACEMSSDVDSRTFAAMTATMVGAAETAFSELKKGVAERVIVEGQEAKIIAMGAGKKALLVTMSDPRANLGLILLEMEKASEKIKKLLGR